MPFFAALEEEVIKAELSGRDIMICFDANSKLGPKHIPGDPHQMSENGKIVEGIIERHALCVGNSIKGKSKGVITRERTTLNGVERSAIYLILLSGELVEHLNEIHVDEEKQFALESITKRKKGTEIKKSDHNSIISNFTFKWDKHLKKHREMHFNLKNSEGLVKFKEATSKDILTSLVSKDNDANILMKKFMKRLNGIIHACFKKTRITEKQDNEDIVKLFNKRRVLRPKKNEESETKNY